MALARLKNTFTAFVVWHLTEWSLTSPRGPVVCSPCCLLKVKIEGDRWYFK